MKTSMINFRVDKITRDRLELLGENNDINISSIIRDAVNQFLENEIFLDLEKANKKEGLHLVKTIGFSELIFWLYQKGIDSEITEIKEFYIQIIELINECKKYPIFNPKLIIELDKVSRELNSVVYDQNFHRNHFQFSGSYENPFDYNVLADFMYSFRYDEENNKIIHCK